jgi:hypothetical protein
MCPHPQHHHAMPALQLCALSTSACSTNPRHPLDIPSTSPVAAPAVECLLLLRPADPPIGMLALLAAAPAAGGCLLPRQLLDPRTLGCATTVSDSLLAAPSSVADPVVACWLLLYSTLLLWPADIPAGLPLPAAAVVAPAAGSCWLP